MEVIPVSEIDQLKPVPTIRVRTYFILRDRLDETILRNALDRLIRDHWRKLGARLATRNEDGLLEYHLPKTFEKDYVLFNWTSKQHHQSITSVGLPKATPPEWGITLQPHIETLEDQFSPSDWPLERKAELPEAPLLFVHLSQFADASCLAINYPHVLCDQFGLSNILKAWLNVTRGEGPPPMLGTYDDFLASSEDYPETVLATKGRQRVRRKGEYVLSILAVVPDLALRRKELQFTLFFPLPLVQSLRERCAEALKEKYGTYPGLSNNDVIVAVSVKLGRIHYKRPRTLMLTQTMQLRGRHPVLQGNDCHGFIHNSAGYSTARFQIDPTTPVSEIAYQNRQALTQSADPENTEIGLAVMREMVRRGQSNLTCEPFDRFYTVSNWTAAWKGLDFSSACESPIKEGNENATPEFLVLGSGAPRNLPMRFTTFVLCKTSEGYWLNYSGPVKAVKLIKEYLKKDPKLEKL